MRHRNSIGLALVIGQVAVGTGCEGGAAGRPPRPGDETTVSLPATDWPTTAAVAVHVSEYTSQFWTYTNWKWFHPAQFLEESLQADGIPFVEISDADITAGRLMNGGVPRYPIMFSLAAEAISDPEASRIRSYVKAGGYVYVGSSSWTRRENGRVRRDAATGRSVFALGDEMGLVPGGWIPIGAIEKMADAPMVDHLPSGFIDWQMPRRYSDLDLWTSHWVWKAMPGFNPHVLMLSAESGKGSFVHSFGNPPAIYDAPNTVFRFGDVNSDGRADLVYRQGQGIYVRISSLSNEGEPGSDYSLNGLALQPAAAWSSWSADYSFDVADVDGDGKADLVGRSGADVQVGLSSGNSFNISKSWTLCPECAGFDDWSDHEIQFADVDGDGAADIIGRSNGRVAVGLSKGARFAAPVIWTEWGAGYSMAFADMDGDGDADIAGRVYGGWDVEVGLSNGKGGGTGFEPSTRWTDWDPTSMMAFADVNGDGAADIVGRLPTDDVRVALSTGVGHAFSSTASSWNTWNGTYTMDLADINGDGAADVVGCNQAGDIQIGLAEGAIGVRAAKLAEKAYGAGKFIYNAEIVPTAGYGGFANDNSEYKTVRASVVEAFNLSTSMPLVTLAPWPFPRQAALIYRHDHYLAADVHGIEQRLAGATSSDPFGEYYLMPDAASGVGACGEVNDYPGQVTPAVQTGALVGAHLEAHASLDDFVYADAVDLIAQTVAAIQTGTGNAMSPIFAAPSYRAVRRSSMQAIVDAGFVTTGEQGVGPLPHFAIDPETAGAHLGSLLQLPTSEWPPYDDMERMTVEPDSIVRAAALSYELGGLVNVYDHVGSDLYAAGCATTRTQLATKYLGYAASLPGIWKTSSPEIRRWWLQRDAHAFSVSFWNLGGVPSSINVALRPRASRAPTDYPVDDLALRIFLDAGSDRKVKTGIALVLDGVLQPGTTCLDNPRLLCTSDPAGNSLLYVKVGPATQVAIQIGQLVVP
jgi:hypothetical protein